MWPGTSLQDPTPATQPTTLEPSKQLERDPQFHADNVPVPRLTSQRPTIADVEIRVPQQPSVAAEADADAKLRVDDGVAGGIQYRVLRKGEFSAVQDSPAEHLDDRRNAEAAVVHHCVTDAGAI